MNKDKKDKKLAPCDQYPDWVENGGGCYCEEKKHTGAWNLRNKKSATASKTKKNDELTN